MSDSEDFGVDLDKCVDEAKSLYTRGEFKPAIKRFEECLSDAAMSSNPHKLAELHLFISKCYKGVKDYKSAIISANAAIDNKPFWKYAFIHRSECFKALQRHFADTDGDEKANIDRDRQEARIIVGVSHGPDPTKTYVEKLGDAVLKADDKDLIFVEEGVHELSALFVKHKSITLIGCSTSKCIIKYKPYETVNPMPVKNGLLVCTNGIEPCFFKRFTFKITENPEGEMRFVGIAGGTVQIEDCLMDCGGYANLKAIEVTSDIFGVYAKNFPAARLIARFCIILNCASNAVIGSNGAVVNLINCCTYGESGKTLSALDMSKLIISNCDLGMSCHIDTAVEAKDSQLSISGTYIHGLFSEILSSSYAMSVTQSSMAVVKNNFIQRTHNGIQCSDSTLDCSHNLIVDCSLKENPNNKLYILGIHRGIHISGGSKLQIVENKFEKCDVGIIASYGSKPLIRGNTFLWNTFTAILIECCSHPNILKNTIDGSSRTVSQTSKRGFGIVCFRLAAGIIGCNVFKNFAVMPILVFKSAKPTIERNLYENVEIVLERQTALENTLKDYFCDYIDMSFYNVDCTKKERQYRDVPLKDYDHLQLGSGQEVN